MLKLSMEIERLFVSFKKKWLIMMKLVQTWLCRSSRLLSLDIAFVVISLLADISCVKTDRRTVLALSAVSPPRSSISMTCFADAVPTNSTISGTSSSTFLSSCEEKRTHIDRHLLQIDDYSWQNHGKMKHSSSMLLLLWPEWQTTGLLSVTFEIS